MFLEWQIKSFFRKGISYYWRITRSYPPQSSIKPDTNPDQLHIVPHMHLGLVQNRWIVNLGKAQHRHNLQTHIVFICGQGLATDMIGQDSLSPPLYKYPIEVFINKTMEKDISIHRYIHPPPTHVVCCAPGRTSALTRVWIISPTSSFNSMVRNNSNWAKVPSHPGKTINSINLMLSGRCGATDSLTKRRVSYN